MIRAPPAHYEVNPTMAQYQELFNEQRKRMEQRDRLFTQSLRCLNRIAELLAQYILQQQDYIAKQRSVSDLSGDSLRSMVYFLTGSLHEKQDEAEAEALLAAERLHSITRETEAIHSDLEQLCQRLAELTNCDVPEYGAGPTALQLAELEQKSERCVRQCQKLSETLYAMHQALPHAGELQTILDTASRLAFRTMDDRNFFDEHKRGLLESALVQLEQLQPHLEELNHLPTSADLHTDLQENIRDALRHWDHFFKNPCAEIVVSDQLDLAYAKARTLSRQLSELFDRMRGRIETTEQEWAKIKTEWTYLTETTPL